MAKSLKMIDQIAESGDDVMVTKRAVRMVKVSRIVFAISFLVVGMLIHKRRFMLEMGPSDWCEGVLDGGFIEVQVDGEIGLTAGLLLYQHGDPADRLIVATAIRSGATLLTADELVLGWDEPFNRQNARVLSDIEYSVPSRRSFCPRRQGRWCIG